MKHLVIIGLVLPEPNSTAAGIRMLQLMTLFQEYGYRITFLTAATNETFSEHIDFIRIALNSNSFNETIKTLNPDIVLFDRYITEEQFGWRVSESCPQAIKILDTEDLHFLREARQKAYKEQREVTQYDWFTTVFKREIAALLRCDIALIISEYEKNLLIQNLGISEDLLVYLPFLVSEVNRNRPSFKERTHFMSIGNFLHEPNWQTTLQLKKIWPKIRRQLPQAELHVYGAYAGDKVQQLHQPKDGFIVKGRAESAAIVFQNYKVLLAPIPFGAGLKGKLWESMVYGLPNVTTPIGAEAMHENMEWNGYIESTEQGFIERAVELYTQKEVWNTKQKHGYLLLEGLFKKEKHANKLFKKIAEIENYLVAHRQKHYLSLILQHHQLQSTKYLSKWIEEKNKK